MKKQIMITGICAIALIFVIILIKKEFSEYEFSDRNSFSETAGISFEVSEEQKSNIIQLLQRKYVEDEDYIGFKKNVENMDLYYANSIMVLAKTLGEENAVEMISDKLEFLAGLDLASMNILNMMYYVNLCDNMGMSYNETEVFECLKKFYDSEEGLFFLNDVSDTINIKLVVTSLVCNTLPDIIRHDGFAITDGIKNVYRDYNFNVDTGITLYNSGGDVLYCMSKLDLITEEVLNNHREWFESWRDYYEAIELDSIESALMYMEYYKIAILFDEKYSAEKLQRYYDRLAVSDIENISDLYMINNILEYVETLDNEKINNFLSQKINGSLTEDKLVEASIDIQETAYGVMLAQNVDMEINSDKLQNYINAAYASVEGKELIIDRVNYLYYTIILDQLNNNYSVTCDIAFLQELIDDLIKELEFKDDIYSDVILARKLTEIVMDLQIHNVDIKISKGQADKIIEGTRKAANSEEILNSVLITEIYIINDMFDEDIIDDELFMGKYRMLTNDGGTKNFAGDESVPDVYSTFRFFVCFERMGNYDNVLSQQEFVNSLLQEEGIYAYSLGNSYASLESVVYGNALAKFIVGGEKEWLY